MVNLLELVVDPSEEDLLGTELHQVLEGLPLHQKVDQAGMFIDADLPEEVHPDELPGEAEHQPRLVLAGVEVVRVHSYNNTAHRTGRVERKGQVLVLLEDGQFALRLFEVDVALRELVDGSLINGVRSSKVNDLTKSATSSNFMVQSYLANNDSIIHLPVHV